MKKLSLDLEMLVVESFDTAPAGRGAGTVHGNAFEAEIGNAVIAKTDVRVDCGSWIDACPSRAGTCEDTCKESCWGTCATCGSTCDEYACRTVYPNCPSGPVCAEP